VIRQPEPLLSKVNAVDVKFCCSALFVQPELQLSSDMSMSLYSSASIAENPLLCDVLFLTARSIIHVVPYSAIFFHHAGNNQNAFLFQQNALGTLLFHGPHLRIK
jgi:hypothetical protein